MQFELLNLTEDSNTAENYKKTCVVEYSSDEDELRTVNEDIKRCHADIITLQDARKLYEILLIKWIHTERLRQISELENKSIQLQALEVIATQKLKDSRPVR